MFVYFPCDSFMACTLEIKCYCLSFTVFLMLHLDASSGDNEVLGSFPCQILTIFNKNKIKMIIKLVTLDFTMLGEFTGL